ncbi:DUF1304 domain-containing protein [Tenacibaculum sp. Bg11-29]|uniref:DUF1304 domain-containing protein n=1 Tax=Tenacibaculum sp. Bg11-29 TaxID=2058306 RepID=UPI000C341F60|nr:DUF1304 domain-containing protein [Tenacibaculum sp. Bg11-29]PKH50169.1 DUF1304 domain-containing protein [Tenacibaculum sp. Bg11-29]
MNTLQPFFIGLVALIHIYILILEMVLWTKPKGIKTFGLKSKEHAEETKVLAANQGLYNGFLAAGLIWSLLDSNYGNNIALFFLTCVTLAGFYGSYSTKKISILYVQAIPAIIALILTLLKTYN